MDTSVDAANLPGCFLFVYFKPVVCLSKNLCMCNFRKQAKNLKRQTNGRPNETVLRFDDSKYFHSQITLWQRMCACLCVYHSVLLIPFLLLIFASILDFMICNFYLFCLLLLKYLVMNWKPIKLNRYHLFFLLLFHLYRMENNWNRFYSHPQKCLNINRICEDTIFPKCLPR